MYICTPIYVLCMYVCVCMYVCICVCLPSSLFLSFCIGLYICVYLRVCLCVCVYIYNIYTHTYIYIHTHTHIYTHTHTHICISIHPSLHSSIHPIPSARPQTPLSTPHTLPTFVCVVWSCTKSHDCVYVVGSYADIQENTNKCTI